MATEKQAAHRARFARQARAGTGKVGRRAKSSATPTRKKRGK
ncbi:MAG TPA: hypothetical protein VFA16_07645 [Mycobacterium sp.]|nr:hypothetical protein [Mycobacterium sp.]HZU47109.1 hypothetical protein [Mycobacterium sp.]